MVRPVPCDYSADTEDAQKWGPHDLSGGAPCHLQKLADPSGSIAYASSAYPDDSPSTRLNRGRGMHLS